ncbi:dihydroorotase [Streptomyces minutiscleroticus]|uniref:dihydroorotase n=1 Tax=Streptomyces minutiscleroticus TaxID=68238 RepID=UPI0033268CD2
MAQLTDTPADLIGEGGRLVTPDGVRDGAVAIRDGRVAALPAPGEPLPAGPRLDARDRYVLPGGIVAVAQVVRLVREFGTKAHVLHVSSAEEADLLSAAAAEGLPLTFEVTGHHLSFTHDDTTRRGPRTRLSPAIRDGRDQRRLWRAVLDGEAATLGSDHAPHTVEEKNRPPAEAPPGLPGVQELATAVWTGLRMRDTAPDEAAAHLARLMGDGPARLFDLPGKGRLEPGADADLALLDPAERWQFSARDVQSLCGWSAYEGWTFTGRFTTTVKGGRVAWDLREGFTGRPAGR